MEHGDVPSYVGPRLRTRQRNTNNKFSAQWATLWSLKVLDHELAESRQACSALRHNTMLPRRAVTSRAPCCYASGGDGDGVALLWGQALGSRERSAKTRQTQVSDIQRCPLALVVVGGMIVQESRRRMATCACAIAVKPVAGPAEIHGLYWRRRFALPKPPFDLFPHTVEGKRGLCGMHHIDVHRPTMLPKLPT